MVECWPMTCVRRTGGMEVDECNQSEVRQSSENVSKFSSNLIIVRVDGQFFLCRLTEDAANVER